MHHHILHTRKLFVMSGRAITNCRQMPANGAKLLPMTACAPRQLARKRNTSLDNKLS
jgi:hypothetical protein